MTIFLPPIRPAGRPVGPLDHSPGGTIARLWPRAVENWTRWPLRNREPPTWAILAARTAVAWDGQAVPRRRREPGRVRV